MTRPSGRGTRLPVVERMMEDGFTQEQIAQHLKTTVRTIASDVAELKRSGAIKEARKELPKSQSGRDELVSQNVKTLDTVRWLINEGRSMLEYMKEWMGINDHDRCDACGCFGRHKNAQDYMAVAKLIDSLTNSLTLLAKVLGEITDSPIINVLQADQDVTTIMQAIARGDEMIGRTLIKVDRQLVALGEEVPLASPYVQQLREGISGLLVQPVGRALHQEIAASKRRAERIGGYQSMREQALLDGPVYEGEYKELKGDN